ncbi:hypothetical protein F2Q69_00060315 [Brassica cretica]|uniref:Replication factor A C-terminal domain-containing protein n=1 Tax=Brassica cretica TaxID=69181 RepID=A0A8S9RKJ2_BRACR|nr:hypothetical protein F2Q69_00060315 [Brassica cretica]
MELETSESGADANGVVCGTDIGSVTSGKPALVSVALVVGGAISEAREGDGADCNVDCWPEDSVIGHPYFRYRVELLVDDGNDNATFVVFDREMVKLTKQDAAGLNLDEINGGGSMELPQCLKTLVDKILSSRYTFKTNAAEFVPVEGGEASATGSNMTGGEEKEPNPSDAGGKGSSRKRPRE